MTVYELKALLMDMQIFPVFPQFSVHLDIKPFVLLNKLLIFVLKGLRGLLVRCGKLDRLLELYLLPLHRLCWSHTKFVSNNSQMIVTRIKLSQLFLVARCCFSVKKDSQWIYSSESEEMVHGQPGYITLAAIPHNPKDTTLRLHKAILNAHLVLSTNISAANIYLKRL